MPNSCFIISLLYSSTCFEHCCAHHQKVKTVLYSIWYRHTCRWPSGAPVERGRRQYLSVSSTEHRTNKNNELYKVREGHSLFSRYYAGTHLEKTRKTMQKLGLSLWVRLEPGTSQIQRRNAIRWEADSWSCDRSALPAVRTVRHTHKYDSRISSVTQFKKNQW